MRTRSTGRIAILMNNYAKAVRTMTAALPSPGMDDAIRSLAMADAADRSARTGSIVAIDPISGQRVLFDPLRRRRKN